MVNTSEARCALERHEDRIATSIRRQTEMSIAYYAAHPDEIDARLDELGGEWDLGRTLSAKAATAVLVGTVFSVLRGRQWLVMPGVVAGFLLQHAIMGWCPPTMVLRELGVRTRREIDTEYFALKALRGDFRALREKPGTLEGVAEAVKAAERP